MGPGCHLKTHDETFYGEESRTGSMEVIYETLLHLNQADLSPLLREHGDPTAKDEKEEQCLGDNFIKDETFSPTRDPWPPWKSRLMT